MQHDASHLLDAAVLFLTGAIVATGVALRADASVRPLALALGTAATLVLVLRRQAPAVTLAVSGGLVFALFALDHDAGSVAVIAPAVALYSLALSRGRMHLAVAVFGAAVAVVVVDILHSGGAGGLTLQTAAHVALVAVPVLAAEALRNRRTYVQLLLERLELAERTREDEARRRAEQERLRISRELHDVVAHTLTTINVQAGVAEHLLDRDPEHARGALTTIATASHEALEELRAILGVVRDQAGAAPLEPSPGLDRVGPLVERVRDTGGDVELDVQGEPPGRIPAAVQLAAFRIVQESLTNARRHAAGSAARVSLTYGDDRLRVAVESGHGETNGRGGRADGVGIVGMRERAAALGGTLEAGRSRDGFRVLAELPYHPA
jgi:signal transduction histidine kinase